MEQQFNIFLINPKNGQLINSKKESGRIRTYKNWIKTFKFKPWEVKLIALIRKDGTGIVMPKSFPKQSDDDCYKDRLFTFEEAQEFASKFKPETTFSADYAVGKFRMMNVQEFEDFLYTPGKYKVIEELICGRVGTSFSDGQWIDNNDPEKKYFGRNNLQIYYTTDLSDAWCSCRPVASITLSPELRNNLFPTESTSHE